MLTCCAASADRLPDVARLPELFVYVRGPTTVLFAMLREHGTIQGEVLDAQVRREACMMQLAAQFVARISRLFIHS